MSKQASTPPAHPFENDFTKAFNFSKIFDTSKLFGDFKFPGVDVEQLTAAYKKNIEALTAANQAAFGSLQALARRQAELARQNFEATTSGVQSVIAAASPEEKIAKQTDAAKAALERNLANVKEVTEMVAKNQFQTFELISNALSQSIDELKNLVKTNRAA